MLGILLASIGGEMYNPIFIGGIRIILIAARENLPLIRW
jgi:hypothetical protein